MKSNLFRFIEGKNHLSTSWHAKMSLNFNVPIKNVLCSNLHTPSMHQKLTQKHGSCCMQNNLLLTKAHVELEDNFIVCAISYGRPMSPCTKLYPLRGDWNLSCSQLMLFTVWIDWEEQHHNQCKLGCQWRRWNITLDFWYFHHGGSSCNKVWI